MKKWTAILILLCVIMVFFLSACSNQSNQTGSVQVEDNTAENSQSETEGSDESESFSAVSLPEASILGQWVPEDGNHQDSSLSDFWQMDELEFFSDGTGTNEYDSFNWVAENERLKIDCNNRSPVTFDYYLSSSHLILYTDQESSDEPTPVDEIMRIYVRPGCTPSELKGIWSLESEAELEDFPPELCFEYQADSHQSEFMYFSLSLEKTTLYYYDILDPNVLVIGFFNRKLSEGDIAALLQDEPPETEITENDYEIKKLDIDFISPNELYLTNPDTLETAYYIRKS